MGDAVKVAWICPKPSSPSGGVYFIHRLAKLTEELGHYSYIRQTEPFLVNWDANPQYQGRVSSGDEVEHADWTIVPEVLWDKPFINREHSICFMQNYIWLNKEYFHDHPGPMITCSRFMSNYAKDVLGVTPLGELTPFLDEDVWKSDAPSERVLIMARRSGIAFRLRDVLEKDGFPVTVIDYDISQRELAKWLSMSGFYIHLPSPEGFPMAALEAMRSGTSVIGTTGGGGNEFMFHKQTAYVVQDPELSLDKSQDNYVERLRQGANWTRSNALGRIKMVANAYEWSLRYPAEATKKQLAIILEKLNDRQPA